MPNQIKIDYAPTWITIGVIFFLTACQKEDEFSALCGWEESLSLSCNCENFVFPADTYDYPIKPDTDAWEQLGSKEERLQACQIPQTILDDMSTEGLIQTCINFPYLGDLLLNVGVNVPNILDSYMNSFSGLQELSKRIDAGSNMLERYKTIDPTCIKNYKDSVPKGHFATTLAAYEMILGHESIIEKLSLEEKQELVLEAHEKFINKQTLPEYYALYSLSTPLYIMAKVMIQAQYAPFVSQFQQDFNLQIFVEKLLWPADPASLEPMFSFIINNAIQFSNET